LAEQVIGLVEPTRRDRGLGAARGMADNRIPGAKCHQPCQRRLVPGEDFGQILRQLVGCAALPADDPQEGSGLVVTPSL
jgi:hypothetical protein